MHKAMYMRKYLLSAVAEDVPDISGAVEPEPRGDRETPPGEKVGIDLKETEKGKKQL